MSAVSGDWLGLRDRVCVVTGAASGIGRGIALELGSAGARVVALDREPDGSAETASLVKQRGGTAQAVMCDVCDPDGVVAAAAATLAAFGPCDVLVNNAGILRSGDIELALADWDRLLAVNLTGYLLCAQASGPQMLKRGAARSCTSPWSPAVSPRHSAAPTASARPAS